jgi:elongation factor P
MLSYNEIKERKYIVLDNEPYEVLDSHVFRKQQRKPVNQTKLRNLINGSIRQETFHANDTVEEAWIDKNKIKYLFKKDNRQKNTTEYWFCDVKTPANRFELDQNVLGNKTKFIKENTEYDALLFDEKVFSIDLPIKIELKVIEAPPAVKGNSVNASNKQIVLETGAVINAPIFIVAGETVRVNTETGEYVERVAK